MKQSCFQNAYNSYQSQEGTVKGYSLAPFPANYFMGKFEPEIEKQLQYFPTIWTVILFEIF